MSNTTGGSAVVIPAVYCTDYYAKEIAAEENGSSDPKFFTDMYVVSPPDSNATSFYTQWICPNLEEVTIKKDYAQNMVVFVDTCTKAKSKDKNFEPSIKCIDDTDVESKMDTATGFKLIKQRISTNFVPSDYHKSQVL